MSCVQMLCVQELCVHSAALILCCLLVLAVSSHTFRNFLMSELTVILLNPRTI